MQKMTLPPPADVAFQAADLGQAEARHIAQKDAVVARQVAQPLVGELRFADHLRPGGHAGRGEPSSKGLRAVRSHSVARSKLRGRLAVDEQDRHGILDRDHGAAQVVQLQAVVLDLHLQDVIARRGELVGEGHGHRLVALDLAQEGFADLVQFNRLLSPAAAAPGRQRAAR